MKVKNIEFAGLLFMTALGALMSVIALTMGHRRSWMMITLTCVMAVIAFIARFRHYRSVKTLNASGRRKRDKAAQ